MTLKTSGLGDATTLKGNPPYRTAQTAGTAVTGRPTFNVQGCGVFAADNSTSSRTDITIEGQYAVPAIGNAIYVPSTPLAAQSIASGVGYYQAFRIYRTISVNQYTVSTLGAASATARLGIYNDDGTGTPSTLVSGTEVSGVSLATAGIKYGSFTAVSLSGSSSGTTYWILTVVQGATCSMASHTPILANQDPGLTTSTVGLAPVQTYKATGITGSLPADNSYSATADTMAIRTALARSA